MTKINDGDELNDSYYGDNGNESHGDTMVDSGDTMVVVMTKANDGEWSDGYHGDDGNDSKGSGDITMAEITRTTNGNGSNDNGE